MTASERDVATAQPTPRKRRHYDLAGPAADFPERDGRPDATLLLCTQQRSGSTLLAEALYFAGGTGCALEYFHSGFRPSFAERWEAQDLPRYLANLYRHRTDPSGMLAVKLFWSDIAALARELAPDRHDDPPSIAARTDPHVYRDIHALLAPLFPQPRYVRLVRRDKIAQAVSTSVAMQRRRWRQIDRDDPAHRRAVEFRFRGIAMALARVQQHDARWEAYFAANGIAPIEMTYEALADDYDGEVQRLLRLLGRHDATVPPARMRKQGDAQSEDIARRFREQFRGLTQGTAAFKARVQEDNPWPNLPA